VGAGKGEVAVGSGVFGITAMELALSSTGWLGPATVLLPRESLGLFPRRSRSTSSSSSCDSSESLCHSPSQLLDHGRLASLYCGASHVGLCWATDPFPQSSNEIFNQFLEIQENTPDVGRKGAPFRDSRASRSYWE
jgi:hypothetical protein